MFQALESLCITKAVTSALRVPIIRGCSIALTPSQLGLDYAFRDVADEWTEEEQYIVDRLAGVIAGVSFAELEAERYGGKEQEFRSRMFDGVSVHLQKAESGKIVMFLAPSGYQFEGRYPG